VEVQAAALQLADGGAADSGAPGEVVLGQALALSKEPKTASDGGFFEVWEDVQTLFDGFLDTKFVTRQILLGQPLWNIFGTKNPSRKREGFLL